MMIMTKIALAGMAAILVLGEASRARAETAAELPPREWPDVADGFASVNAMGQDGTTGGDTPIWPLSIEEAELGTRGKGKTVTVTNQVELERYAMAVEPYIIRVKGAIHIKPKPNPVTRFEHLTRKEIHVASHKTIIGVGKTGEIVNGGFFLRPGTHNVIIRNLTIRDTYVEGDWAGLTQDDDGLQMDGAHHVWVDHCHFTRHGDSCFDGRAGSTYITVSWCIFSNQNKTLGIGWDKEARTNYTLHHIWFRDVAIRTGGGGQVLRSHLYNNYFQNVGWGPAANTGTHLILENNLFDNVTNPHMLDPVSKYGPSTIVATGNIYRNVRGRQETGGEAFFNPHDFYEYTLDNAEDLPGILAQYAGPQENIGAPRPGVGPKGEVRPGLRFRYYEAEMQQCGDMEGKKPVKQGVIGTPSLEIEGRREEQFGVIYDGFVKIPAEDVYTFSTASDDGSVLWLDGKVAVSNDGLHPPAERRSTILLAAGYHAIKVAYFNGPMGGSLDVYWQRSDGKKQLLPAEVLFHGAALPAKAAPLVFDKEIGHYKDLSYEDLSDEGLSWEQRTCLFGGETVHYSELTKEQREAKENELAGLLAKIDTNLVKRCEADIRKWLNAQIAAIPPAYADNCIRGLIQHVAPLYHVPIERLSFKGTVDSLRHWGDALYIHHGKPRKQRAMIQILFGIIADDLVPYRPERSEPRFKKRRAKATG